MTVKSKWQSVVQVADFAIDGAEIHAVVTDERGYIIASVVIAVCYDDTERDELYWALRHALEGRVIKVVINDDQ